MISFSLITLIALAMVLGIAINLIYFMFIVLQLDPWYEPQYLIPIGGMIIGKTMTGVTLGVNNLLSGMKDHKEKIEGDLSYLLAYYSHTMIHLSSFYIRCE